MRLFPIKNLATLSYSIGFEYPREDRNILPFSQTACIDRRAQRFSVAKTILTPASPTDALGPRQEEEDSCQYSFLGLEVN